MITAPFSEELTDQQALTKSGGYIAFKGDLPIFKFNSQHDLSNYEAIRKEVKVNE